MANLMLCKHNDGRGHCSKTGEYCVEGPCPDEELVEYAPVMRGRWIPLWFDEEDKEFGEPPSDYKCSVCSNIVQSRHCGQYCPNCGAIMDLEG